jgi:hypothetical protein
VWVVLEGGSRCKGCYRMSISMHGAWGRVGGGDNET